MITQTMICHPKTPAPFIHSLHVHVTYQAQFGLRLYYDVKGDLAQLKCPSTQPSQAVDGLWQHTCFEVFIAIPNDDRYYEFNFSPSTEWAGYAFSDYRTRQTADYVPQTPTLKITQAAECLQLEAFISADDLPLLAGLSPQTNLQLGLSAVIEAQAGTLSYWALQHPDAQPNFHHRDSFMSLDLLNKS